MRVCVIGGGAVGLFCAWRIAQRGAQVVLVEPRSLAVADPHAASWAAAGMLGAASEALDALDAARRLSIGAAALAAWRRTEGALGVDLLSGFGTVLVADRPDRAARIERLRMAAQNAGINAAWLTPEALARMGLHLAPHAEGGLHLPDERRVDIPTTLHTLATAAAAAGGLVRTDRAHAIEPARESVRVRFASGGAEDFDAVVAAPGIAGAESLASSVPALGLLTPAKGQMALLAADAPVVVRGSEIYLTPRREGLAIGASMEPGRADFAVDETAIARLRGAAERLLPGLRAAPLVAAWAGVRPMSPDHDPMVGPSGAPGVLIAAGHSRNGWLLAPLTADMIAAHIFNEPAPIAPNPFDPERFARSTS